MALGELTVPPSLLGLPANLAIFPHFFFRCGITETIIIVVVFAFYESTHRVSSPVLLLPSAGYNLNVSLGSSNITYLYSLSFYDYCVIMF